MTAIVSSETPARHSPCVGMCRLDDASAVCIGCGRSRDEIANWISMSESERDGVWSLLPGRLSKLSVGIRLLPWTAPELLHWAADTIDQRRGTWVTGVPGAVGEFACGTEGPLSVALTKDVVAARMGDAEFRLRVSDKLRAFAVADDGPIVLGLPRSRATRQPATAFTCLGKDVDAIDPANRNGYLFDFGLGRKNARFCIRTGSSELLEQLEPLCGRDWASALSVAGSAILKASPHRVVESEAVRIEVFAPIPQPGGTSPSGAHTHFLPQFLARNEEVPEGLKLPDYAMQVAIFYPNKT